MTQSKPDGATWEEYAYEENCIESEKYSEFCESMASQARDAIREVEDLDASRYRVETDGTDVRVWPEGWEMEVDDVLRLRDALREYRVGDKTVSVRCHSAGPSEEVSENFPPELTRGVTIRLWADVEETRETLDHLLGALNEVAAKTEGY